MQAIISEIDQEIARLEKAKEILNTLPASFEVKRGPGRPKSDKSKPAVRKTRTLSDEARARIAEAQKKRWAASKKQK